MLVRMRLLLEGTGFGRFEAKQFVIALGTLAIFLGMVAYSIVPVAAMAISVSVATCGLVLEILKVRQHSRRKAISSVWPEILESLLSASSAGVSLSEALMDLSDSSPAGLRPHFKALEQNLDAGLGMISCLERFKNEVGDASADRLVELLRIANFSGGVGYHEALRHQVHVLRSDLALWGELESKQGWVTGTAKLALAAPWFIVAVLCTRPENLAIYSSQSGTALLVSGLIVSMFAFRLIQKLGTLRKPTRIFIQ